MNLSRLSDHEKWSRFKSGDVHALSNIYNEHSKALYLYGLKFTQNQMLVEDTLQDLFTELMKNHRNLGDTDNILFYLFKSFKRKLIRNLKKEKKSGYIRSSYTSDFEVTYSIEHDIIAEDDLKKRSAILIRALKKLTPRQKEAIYLKFTKELNYSEISEVMEISVEACRNLIAKAVKILKVAVREKGGVGMIFFMGFLKRLR